MPQAAREVCRLIVLGSTGSIGTQTLEVVEHLNALHARGAWPTRYEVVGLAARNNTRLLDEQAAKFRVTQTAVGGRRGEAAAGAHAGVRGEGRWGEESPERLVREVECDVVVAAMSGAAGLPATLAAVELGRDVALANKETLVAAGELIVPAARATGARLVPVDSEHAGVWQAMEGSGAPPLVAGPGVARVVLTASGGPFRSWTREQMRTATPEQALKHPTWSMGRKVTIDSASLMNKALELIEAHWLFGLPCERLAAVIHPQSIVHALVEYTDGSILAQLAPPDMKLPIQQALTWPARGEGCSRRMDWGSLRRLDFEEPDLERFPSLALAFRAIREGGICGAVMNAANEEAVGAFLEGRIGFCDIPALTAAAMDRLGSGRLASLGDVAQADAAARGFVAQRTRA
jgi:1-deoxy-D-xylulose-5-phosphate reductoisomerase